HRGATGRCLDVLHQAVVSVQAQRLCEVVAETMGDGSAVWRDPVRAAAFTPDDFKPATASAPAASARRDLPARPVQHLATGSGRGQAALVQAPEGAYVLRHYRRGGLVARLSDD